MGTTMQRANVDLADAIADFPRESDSWFDLAAKLYVDLAARIGSEELFISQFFEENELSDLPNPNRRLLLDVQERVARAVSAELCLLVTYEDACERIGGVLGATSLEPFADERGNDSTLIWAAIKGIDLAYSWDGSSFELTRRGPLNTMHRDKVGVYLKPLDAPLRAFSKESAFERVVSGRRLNAQLNVISFYWKHPNQELPTIVGVRGPIASVSTGDLRSESNGAELATVEQVVASHLCMVRPLLMDRHVSEYSDCDLSIGIVPFTCINFLREGDNSPIRLEAGYGSSFIVTYHPRYDEIFHDMVRKAVEAAVTSSCDILVFPELTMAPSALGVISSSLRGLSEKAHLKLVVAGSTYELNEDGTAGDNVCHVFDALGNEIGVHYKRMPFEMNLGGNVLVEALGHPGRQTAIVDVEGVGRVVIGICKDLATNDDYVTRFVSDFEADLVLLPALSPSLDRAFAEPTRSLATRHLAVSVICNQCGARMGIASDEGMVEYGRVVVPAKGDALNQKQADFASLALCRNHDCFEKCCAAYREGNPICCFRKVHIVSNPEEQGFRLFEEVIDV